VGLEPQSIDILSSEKSKYPPRGPLGRLLPRRSFWSFEIFSIFYFLFSIIPIVFLFWSKSRSTLPRRGCVWQREIIWPWPCEGGRRWEMYNRQSRTAGSWLWVRTNREARKCLVEYDPIHGWSAPWHPWRMVLRTKPVKTCKRKRPFERTWNFQCPPRVYQGLLSNGFPFSLSHKLPESGRRLASNFESLSVPGWGI